MKHMKKTTILSALFAAFALFAFGAPSAHAEIVRERGNGVVWYINRVDGHRYQLSRDAKKMFEQVKTLAVPLTNDILFSDSMIDTQIRSNSLKTCKLAKAIDTDQDCIDNAYEEAIYSNPNSKDSDGDGFHDFTELMTGHSLIQTTAEALLGAKWYRKIPSLESRLNETFVLETQHKNEMWYVNPSTSLGAGKENRRIFVNSASLVRTQVYLSSKFVTRAEVSKFPVGKWPTKEEVKANREALIYPQIIDVTLGYKDAKKNLLTEAKEIFKTK